jgi:hypothetical protein
MTDLAKAMTNLSPASYNLLVDLIKDAPNWSGTPLIDISKEQRGNLSDLKRRGFLTTFMDEGCMFAIFTDVGKLAAERLDGQQVWMSY